MNLKLVLFLTAMVALCATSVYAFAPVVLFNDNLDDSGTLDLADTSAIIDGTPTTATVIAKIQSGYNGGLWTGTGITSSSAAANTKYALAPLTVAEYQTLKGTHAGFYGPTNYSGTYGSPPTTTKGVDDVSTLSAGSTLIAFALKGDFNLDGAVNATDLGKVKNNVVSQNHGGTLSAYDWVNGDTNYNGTVDATDLGYVKNTVIAQNHNGTYTPLQGPAGSDLTPVPEPSTFILGFLAVTCFLGFRKFSK